MEKLQSYKIIKFPNSFLVNEFADYPAERSLITPVRLINHKAKEIIFLNSNVANDFRNRVKVLKETKQIDLNQYNFQIDFLQMDSDENHYLSIKGIILKEQKENSNEIKYDI